MRNQPEYNILLVEDDESVREISATVLQSQGYEVVEAGDGKEAVKHLKDGQLFDLLFTDVVLPGGINGVEIAEEAKHIQPGIKVLFTTGYAKNAVVKNGQLDPSETVRRHINWNNQGPDLKEDLAHLVQDIKRRICGIASAGFPSFYV